METIIKVYNLQLDEELVCRVWLCYVKPNQGFAYTLICAQKSSLMPCCTVVSCQYYIYIATQD